MKKYEQTICSIVIILSLLAILLSIVISVHDYIMKGIAEKNEQTAIEEESEEICITITRNTELDCRDEEIEYVDTTIESVEDIDSTGCTESIIQDPSTDTEESTQQEPVAEKVSYFHYYGIWTGQYWHFTPDQIDNQWSGYKKSKPKLPDGTTKAWQEYLYSKLEERSLEWFYKYAVAQAMQESGFNPYNNISRDHISWIGGRETYDCGLFSFKDIYWNQSYGDVCDYRANINAYVDKIANILIDSNSQDKIDLAISNHYNPSSYNPDYVQLVKNRMNELWEL